MEPISPPEDISPLDSIEYAFNIQTSGPPTIDTVYMWTIDGVFYNLPITGTRVVLFELSPNWQNGFDERLEWKTAVIRSYDGTEQRTAQRVNPRRSYEFSVRSLDSRRSKRVESKLYGWQTRLFAIPVWPEESSLIASAAAGDTTIYCDTANRSLSAGVLVMLSAGNENTVETVEVATVGSGSMTLDKPLQANWPIGTNVHPLSLAHSVNTVAGKRMTDSINEYRTAWAASPKEANVNIPAEAAPTTYRGSEIIEYQPNWARDLTQNFESDTFTLDGQTGHLLWDIKAPNPTIIRQYSWTLQGLDEVGQFKAFLGRRHGMQNPVFIPSWNEDFISVATSAIGASSTTIDVYDDGYHLFVNGGDIKDITIALKDGSFIHRRVTLSTDLEDGTVRLSLDNAVGIDINPEDIQIICNLAPYRLATDIVNIQWETNRIAIATTNMRLVPDDL